MPERTHVGPTERRAGEPDIVKGIHFGQCEFLRRTGRDIHRVPASAQPREIGIVEHRKVPLRDRDVEYAARMRGFGGSHSISGPAG